MVQPPPWTLTRTGRFLRDALLGLYHKDMGFAPRGFDPDFFNLGHIVQAAKQVLHFLRHTLFRHGAGANGDIQQFRFA